MSFELPSDIVLGNPEKDLEKINAIILRRVDTLQRLSKKGCATLRMMNETFTAIRAELCKIHTDELAFLQNDQAVRMLIVYENMNPDVIEDAPLATLIEQRRLYKALVIFKQEFTNLV